MCNKMVEEDSNRNPVPIRETGIGWKIFRKNFLSKDPREHYKPVVQKLLSAASYYRDTFDDWVHYVFDTSKGDGFCFFRSELEAHVAASLLPSWAVVKKIEYKGGLQERDEISFIEGMNLRVALCKSFRIMEEVNSAQETTKGEC